MPNPIDPLVADMVNVFDDNLREDFEERAAIMEFDANLPRGHAECLALLDVLRRHPAVLLGVNVQRIELHGEPRWILATVPGHARAQLLDVGGVETSVRDLVDIINEKYGGIAMLSPMT